MVQQGALCGGAVCAVWWNRVRCVVQQSARCGAAGCAVTFFFFFFSLFSFLFSLLLFSFPFSVVRCPLSVVRCPLSILLILFLFFVFSDLAFPFLSFWSGLVAHQSHLCVNRWSCHSSPTHRYCRSRTVSCAAFCGPGPCGQLFHLVCGRGTARAVWPCWSRLPLPPPLCLWRLHAKILGSPWLRRPPRSLRASQLTCHAGVGPNRARLMCCSPNVWVIDDFHSPDVARAIVAEHDSKVCPSEVVKKNGGTKIPFARSSSFLPLTYCSSNQTSPGC